MMGQNWEVVVTKPLPETVMPLLEAAGCRVTLYGTDGDVEREVLEQAVTAAHGILVTPSEKVDSRLVELGPKLRVISTVSVGYDHVDVAAATRRGIPVGHTPGVLTETTADLAWALLMATARRITEAERYLRAGQWKTWSPMLLVGQDVYGKTLGIIGMGRIGQAVARRARGFDMKVLYHNRSRRPEMERELQVTYCDLPELLEQSDFVVLLTPLTPETRGLMGQAQFSRMQRHAVFINVSRGATVDEQALYQALSTGQIWAAGLDVWGREPVDMNHPLLTLPNVVALPHIGSASIATRTKMAQLAVQNLIKGLKGEPLLHVVNPEVYRQNAQ